MLSPGKLYELDASVADALKTITLVNIVWGDDQNMLCGDLLAIRPKIFDVVCGNEEQAWMINRAKAAMARGDEAAARAHLAPMIRTAVH